MKARVESVNVGSVRTLIVRGVAVRSGIFKAPQPKPWLIDAAGLAGDAHVEPRKYGDAHHAVHAYPSEHYEHWAKRYEHGPFEAGGFGENLTVRGAVEGQVRIGDVIACGEALLAVSQPRIPCRKLTARVGIEGFARSFLESRRTGYYLRVVRPGHVAPGDAFEVVDSDPESPTVAEFTQIAQFDYWDVDGLTRLLRSRGLPPKWRDVLEDKLARARPARARGSWFGTRRLRIASRREEGNDLVMISLECAHGLDLPEPQAGQSLTLVVPSGPHRGARSALSLSADPAVSRSYHLTIRRSDGNAEAALCDLAIDDGVGCLAPSF